MVKKCLMKLAVKWMIRNKTRFILNWISYAIVSVFLITICSFIANISTNIQDIISSDAVCNQIHIQNFRVSGDEIVNDMTKKQAVNIKKELNAYDIRIIYDNQKILSEISPDNISTEIMEFDAEFSLIMENDKSDEFEYVGEETIGSGELIINANYAKEKGWTKQQALGKTIELTDETGIERIYIVKAVISGISKASYLNKSNIYIPIDEEKKISLCSMDFSESEDINELCKYVEDTGYVYTTTLVNTDRMEAMSNSYQDVCTLIGGVFIFICMMSLINSMLVTINENSAFMELFRLMGLRISEYRFYTCFLCMIQGFIGGLIGVIMAIISQKGLFGIIKYLELDGLNIIDKLQIDLNSCVFVLGIDITFSIIVGILAFNISMKNSVERISDSELI